MIQWQISHTLAIRAENASGDWHDLCECVNLASTRWINAITGQTWRGENPFKARKAKQGPCLIHLANLRVMYECQGTLVRRGERWVYAGSMGWVYFLSFLGRGGFLVAESPWDRVPCFPPDKASGAWTWKWQKDALSGREAGLLCKWGGEMLLWSAGQQSEYRHALPYQELNQVLSATLASYKLNDWFLYRSVNACDQCCCLVSGFFFSLLIVPLQTLSQTL